MAKYLDYTGLTRYDGKVKALISANASAIETAEGNITSEASTRQSADSALSGRITTLENAGFITKAVNDLTNYYTKANTYTKTEVNNLIGNLKTIEIKVVSSLPSTGESNVIYLVAHSHGTGDVYDEYVWVASTTSYEKIGNTDIDLSGYVEKDREINGHALSQDIDLTKADIGLGNTVDGAQINVIETIKVDGVALTPTNKAVNIDLSGKVDKVTGKGLSTNDYTTAEKNKLSGIATGAQVNVIETVKVNGTALTPSSKAVNVTVPTKTSDLTNDSGYITGVTSISNAEIDALFA